MIASLDNLIHVLSKLPGLGRRSAERAALALVRRPESLLDTLVQALQEARENVCLCIQCGAFTTNEQNPCPLCTDETRDATKLCVVEDPADIYTIEASGAFHGRYHALMGKLSPSRQSGTSELRISELLHRIQTEHIAEVILALSTDLEGEATANYISEQLAGQNIRLSRLAFGLPCGSGVAYTDALTLKRAIAGRTTL